MPTFWFGSLTSEGALKQWYDIPEFEPFDWFDDDKKIAVMDFYQSNVFVASDIDKTDFDSDLTKFDALVYAMRILRNGWKESPPSRFEPHGFEYDDRIAFYEAVLKK